MKEDQALGSGSPAEAAWPRRNGHRQRWRTTPLPVPPFKRLLDLTLSALSVGVLWPIFALAYALIKLDSPGPALLRQKRVGYGGRDFTYYKFRTMHHHSRTDLTGRLPSGDLRNSLLSPPGKDPKVTPIGWVLRTTTLDELPQLFNVVRGDMSLVGPRPDMPEIVAHWPAEFHARHQVKPGMTGLAQVNGRSDLTHYEKLRYDLDYVRRHTPLRDIEILLKTLKVVLSKKGAR
ncbi:MAG TPA: sugar transferase [Dehalococcoidia bacterium]|nr:sugar transferase [Dehalococcoidia bacterium]